MSSSFSSQMAPLRRKRLADAPTELTMPNHNRPLPTTSTARKSSKTRAIVHFFSCGIQEKNSP